MSVLSVSSAVSRNTGSEKTIRYAAHIRWGKIEMMLGIHHAASNKKNLILMTSSFALSIILFFSFSVMIDFVDDLMPQSVATSDIDIASDHGNTIPCHLIAAIQGMDGVKEVYGRRSALNLPASFHTDESLSNTVDFISYDDFDLQCIKKDGNLKKGSDGMIRYLLIKKLAKNHMLMHMRKRKVLQNIIC